jgi:hypothetical protein
MTMAAEIMRVATEIQEGYNSSHTHTHMHAYWQCVSVFLIGRGAMA